jgi:hypothetical protein
VLLENDEAQDQDNNTPLTLELDGFQTTRQNLKEFIFLAT